MNDRDTKRARTRKISIDMPMELWTHFERNVQPHGYKIKEYILGAFEALKFLDTFLAEHLTEKQLLAVSPLIMQEIEKIEKIYVNLDAPLKKMLKNHHVSSTIMPSDIVSRFKELDMNHTSHLLREIMESTISDASERTQDHQQESEKQQAARGDEEMIKRKILALLND